MSLLFRYLARHNALLLLPTLAVGIGLYVLTDLFERLDNFIEAGVPARMVAYYFAVKMPLVISQILPVIFLLSTVIQLCVMARNRELTALQAGGISLGVAVRSMVICGVFWGCVQLGFSEGLGVAGERESTRVWQEEVRKRNLAATVLSNIWFTEGRWIVSLGTLNPDASGTDFRAYETSADGLRVTTVAEAPVFTARPGAWILRNAVIHEPEAFRSRLLPELTLPLEQNPAAFRLVSARSKPQQLPLWQLGEAIDQLRASGSNVETLRTAWHMKLAYAASLVVMALMATALVSWRDNIYIATALALVCTFLYYALFTLGTSLGQRGIVSPPLAAWGANLIAAIAALSRLVPVLLPRYFGK